MKFLSIISIFFFMFAFSPIAHAADTGDEHLKEQTAQDMTAPKEEKSIKKSDMSNIPDDYIIEASKFGETCRNDFKMPLYFNCQCLAVKYLDHRIELGPEAHSSAVRNLLGKDCKDGTGIAGQMYKKCLYNISTAPKHLDPETFCSCYSNTFASYFESLPGAMNPRMKVSLMSRARLKCQDPEAARKIYGIR